MRTFISYLVVFILLMHAGSCISYDNKVYLEYNGQKGYWFDELTTDLILQDLLELSILREKRIPSFNQKLNLQETSIKKYKLELKFADSISDRYKNALKKSEENYSYIEKKYLEELNKTDKWYKSSAFLFICGAVSGGVLAVGLSFGLKGN